MEAGLCTDTDPRRSRGLWEMPPHQEKKNQTREGPLLGGNEVKLPGDPEEAKPLSTGFDSIFHSKVNLRPSSKKDDTWHPKRTDI